MARPIDNVPREVFDASRGKRQKYQDLVVGQPGWWALIRYELIVSLAGTMPGALGLFLRSKLYPRLLSECGRNVFFGVGVTLRHPHKIRIGNDVVIDDGCVLDAKGSANAGITIGNGVFLGRHTIMTSKDGDIVLEDGVNVSAFCLIFSASHVRCGRNTLIAAYTFIVGGDHESSSTDRAIADQARSSRGVTIGHSGWIGTGVSILDGVSIGHDVIVGANSVVTEDLADFVVAAGSPATVRKMRTASADHPATDLVESS